MTTFTSEIESFSPSWLLGKLSGAFVGVLSLMGDAASEAYSEAGVMPWLLEATSPDDVLPFVGAERKMPRYPGESALRYRMRLWDAWTAYEFGGAAKAIEDQLAALGLPGKVIYGGPYNPGDTWWSQFWVFFPVGTHSVTAQGALIGTFTVGDGTIIGPVGLTRDQVFALRELVKKWKHSQSICRAFIFELSGWTIGTGHIIGEPGLVIGGETAIYGA